MGSAAAGAMVGTVVGGPLGLLAGIIVKFIVHEFFLIKKDSFCWWFIWNCLSLKKLSQNLN